MRIKWNLPIIRLKDDMNPKNDYFLYKKVKMTQIKKFLHLRYKHIQISFVKYLKSIYIN
jgi:hypothetical protein